MNRSKAQRGLTLVELVITIVVLAIAMSATLTAFSNSMKYSADPMWQYKSVKLAQLYLDEILSKKYDTTTPLGGQPASTTVNCGSIGPEAGEIRTTYDDVDDYHDPVDVTPSKVTGALDASYASFKIHITVACEVTGAGTVNDQLKIIVVTITPPGQSTMDFAVYKGNF